MRRHSAIASDSSAGSVASILRRVRASPPQGTRARPSPRVWKKKPFLPANASSRSPKLLMRNQSQGWTRSSSNGSPAAAKMSPSPLVSMTTRGAVARLVEHLVGGEDELVRLKGDGVAHAVGAAAPDESPAAVVLHEPWVGVVPLTLRGVVDGAATLHAVHDLLTEAGDGLAAGAVVQGEQPDDEAAAGEP